MKVITKTTAKSVAGVKTAGGTRKKTISPRVIKILWGKSGRRCALCQTNIVEDLLGGGHFPLGVMAHIEGENPSAARYNASMTEDERASEANLVVFCPTCHTKIDSDSSQYTRERLKDIKAKHEAWVLKQTSIGMQDVSFAELEVILTYIGAAPLTSEELYLIPPGEKIVKNGLSDNVKKSISMGMIQQKQVADYLNRHPDPSFAERLSAGFRNKYHELKAGGLDADELFHTLWDFAAGNSSEFRRRAAGLAVLTYFFEQCEVFEKC